MEGQLLGFFDSLQALKLKYAVVSNGNYAAVNGIIFIYDGRWIDTRISVEIIEEISRGVQISEHNELTNRDESGNHESITPNENSAGSFKFFKADGLTPILTIDTINDATLYLKSVMTKDGGFAIKVIAGEQLSRGEIVSFMQGAGGADGKVWKTPASGNENEMPCGVVYANAEIGGEVWIVVSGIAYILPETGITAARGNVIITSTSQSGRVIQSASGGAVSAHWRECGHFVDAGTGNGVITRAVLHFN